MKLDKKIYQKKIGAGLYIYVNAFDHIQQQLFWYGYYEKELASLFREFINADDTVIDIGANIGYFSLLAAKNAHAGSVYAFEPVSFHFNHLSDNIALNHLTNIFASPYAISNTKEEASIFISGSENTGMSSLTVPENFSGSTEKIATISLDEFVSIHQIIKVNLVKIDIEGAELKALQGMTATLTKFKPLIIAEVIAEHLQRFDHSPAQLFNFLYSLGYRSYIADGLNTLKQINTPTDSYAVIFAPADYHFPAGIKLC